MYEKIFKGMDKHELSDEIKDYAKEHHYVMTTVTFKGKAKGDTEETADAVFSIPA